MNPTDRHARWIAALLSLLFALAWAAPAHAETTRCVDTLEELFAALEETDVDVMRINVVRGTYTLSGTHFTVGTNGFSLIGGWDAGCSERQLDPRLTMFTGAGDLNLFANGFIRVESLAFIDSGYLTLKTGMGQRSVHLERVWLQNLCAGIRCDDARRVHPVQLYGDYVRLGHVVATAHGPLGCAVTVESNSLREASVGHSLFVDNHRGLCVQHLSDDPVDTDDFKVVVDNSLFWSNSGADILTRYSPLITLRHNFYQSLDLSPASSIAPVATLSGNPNFQDITTRDFQLQASSPAIDSGRFSLQLAQEYDLVGNQRVLGDAPDRGPFEFNSNETPLVVENTLDSLAPAAIGSLRWAIEQANARPGLDRIRFALNGCPQIIDLNALLPDITESVFIDGYSQSGSVRNASNFGFAPTLCVGLRDPSLALDHALRIPAGSADGTLLWVSGLAFGGFDTAAVRIAAGSNTWVFGNQFGGSLGGTALGNNAVNVRLGGTSHDGQIGGLDVSHRNLIGSAYSAGVELLDNGSGEEGHDHLVRNNFIGLRSNGTQAAPNALGVRVRTHRNRIEDNFISGNQGDGILIEGPLAFENEIRDNSIGRKTFAFCLPPCTPDYALGNAGAGVRLAGGGHDNLIFINRIAHNGGAGVRLEDGLRNYVGANAITSNGALGIDIGTLGVNPEYNTGLVVTGTYANRGVNAPTLTAASGRGAGGRVTGTIASHNGSHLVEIFRNASCDASGRGEGATLLFADLVYVGNAPIGGNGTASFDWPLPDEVSFEGTTLTATLIDLDGNSSEFSACRAYETILCRELFKDGLEDNPPPPPCTPL